MKTEALSVPIGLHAHVQALTWDPIWREVWRPHGGTIIADLILNTATPQELWL